MNSILKKVAHEVVAVHDIDYLQRLKISSVLQYFQNIATSHAEELSIGYNDMIKKNLFWMITRISVLFDKYPKLNSQLSVTTLPKVAGIANCVRDYLIEDDKGIVVRGSSMWCAIDCTTKTIKRCKPLFDYHESQFYSGKTMDDPTPLLNGLTAQNTGLDCYGYKVLLTDIDRNLHMNNARYADYIFCSSDKIRLDNYCVQRFDINYISELTFGNDFTVTRQDIDDTSHYLAMCGEKEIFRAKIQWTKFKA